MASQDSPIKRLLVQASHYSVSGLFALIGGLITFPLFTRVFSLEDYGVMNLVAATVTVSVAIGKLGVQHSIVRYHSEISANKSRYTMSELQSTTFFGMAGSALVVMGVVTIGSKLAPSSWLGDRRIPLLVAIASLLVFVQVVESALVNLLRAEQRTAALMKYQVTKKYVSVGLMVGAVLLIARSLYAFYTAQVVAETLVFLGLARVVYGERGRPRPNPASFSRPLYFELLGFGIPMMIGYELAGIVLAVGDRYVIEGLLGEAPLGLYGAAYNLCQYVQGLVIASIGSAIMPIYMQMYDRQGPEETTAFIARSLRTYTLFGAPVIAGLAAVGGELLPSLASEKYAEASVILPWVIAGMVVEGANPMLGAGLFIHRRTKTVMTIILSCAVLNIALNLLLVPRVGIKGAAVATLVSYLASASALCFAAGRLLPVALPSGTMVRAGLVSLVMYFAVRGLYPGRRLLTVGVRMAVGAPLYVLPMVLIDADGRALVRKAFARFRGA
jgi:O-antigen/teichoic acid export membrane protein